MTIKERLRQLATADSARGRVAITFVSNLAKSGFGFLTTIIIARQLGPARYGEYGFFLASFSVIAYLLDAGGANAFYSHIAKRVRGRNFYLVYVAWMAAQFVLTGLILLLFSPAELLRHLLLSDDRVTMFMAFCAVFGQQQVLAALSMILESDRKTLKSQTVLLVSAIYYLAAVGTYCLLAPLDLRSAFAIMLSQQVLAGVLLYRSASSIVARAATITEDWRQCWREYATYCKPLIPSTIFAFIYNFSDKWFLQRFSGSVEQGYFQISNQLSLVTMVFTTSVLRVFAKEAAAAMEAGDRVKLESVYRQTYVSTILIISFLTGMICPWAREILQVSLGAQYAAAANILVLLLIYPIYQSLGQIAGTFLLSIGQTALHSAVSIAMIVVSLPLGFLLLAPPSLHGFNLGGLGLALKLLLVSLFSVNVLNYVAAKRNGFKLDFASQAAIPLFLGGGALAKYLVTRLVPYEVHSPVSLGLAVGLTTLLYLLVAFIIAGRVRKGGTAGLLPFRIGARER